MPTLNLKTQLLTLFAGTMAVIALLADALLVFNLAYATTGSTIKAAFAAVVLVTLGSWILADTILYHRRHQRKRHKWILWGFFATAALYLAFSSGRHSILSVYAAAGPPGQLPIPDDWTLLWWMLFSGDLVLISAFALKALFFLALAIIPDDLLECSVENDPH